MTPAPYSPQSKKFLRYCVGVGSRYGTYISFTDARARTLRSRKRRSWRTRPSRWSKPTRSAQPCQPTAQPSTAKLAPSGWTISSGARPGALAPLAGRERPALGRHRDDAVVLDLEDLERVEVDDRDDALDRPRVAVVGDVLAVPGRAPGEAAARVALGVEPADRLGVDHDERRVLDAAARQRGEERGVLAARLGRETRLVRRDRRLALAQLLPALGDRRIPQQHGDHEPSARARVPHHDLGAALAGRGRDLVEAHAGEAQRLADPCVRPHGGDGRSQLVRRERIERVGDREGAQPISTPPSARGSDPALSPSGPRRDACTWPALPLGASSRWKPMPALAASASGASAPGSASTVSPSP